MLGNDLFRSRTGRIFFGDEEPWSMFPTSSAAFSYDHLNSSITIKRNGLYLVYVQVWHASFNSRCYAFFSVSLNKNIFQHRFRSLKIARYEFVNSLISVNRQEWLRCPHRPPTADYGSIYGLTPGRETCNMFAVRPFLAGDRIEFLDTSRGYGIIATESASTFFGIVKLA